MIDKALDWFIPHICSSCGEVGSLLCPSCEDDIVEDSFAYCLRCLRPCYGGNLCRACVRLAPYQQAYSVGWRQGALKKLIDSYKFDRSQAAASNLAGLLDRRLPVLPKGTNITYIPTIETHIRRRGFDHMRMIAIDLAARRDIDCRSLLERRFQTVQHGASKQKRLSQAKVAFRSFDQIVSGPILLLDDIYTTGATVDQAAKILRRRHKQSVIVVVIARQPLDDLPDL